MAAKRYPTTKRELTRAPRDTRTETTPPEGEPVEGPTLKSPTYEALVAVQNPELLLRAYHARWSTFYRNCPLDVMHGATGSVVLRLSYPSDCWPEISRLSLAAGVRAGLVVAGAKSPKVTVKALSPRVGRFDVRWT